MGAELPWHDELLAHIRTFVRPVTFLEVGTGDYAFAFSSRSIAYGVALLAHAPVEPLIRTCYEQKNHMLTIMQPLTLDLQILKRFGECEHLDMVLIHEEYLSQFASLQKNKQLIDELMALGDYVYIEASTDSFMQLLLEKGFDKKICDHAHALFVAHCPKTKIPFARFTQKKIPHGGYEIVSTCQKKLFKKTSLKEPIPWIHGINMVTFVMLRGVYPTDEMIRESIAALPSLYPKHNDLVIGNIIVKGDRLIPIDIADKRRGGTMRRCISTALNAFKPGNCRLSNPQGWIDSYYREIG